MRTQVGSSRAGFAVVASLFIATTATGDGFLAGSPRWPAGDVVMHLHLGPSGTLHDGTSSWNGAVEDALAEWNQQLSSVQFTVVRDSTASIGHGDGINSVFWNETVHGRPLGDVIALTTTRSRDSIRVEADVVFNPAYFWNSYRGPRLTTSSGEPVYDIRRIARREFGQVLGFGPSDDAGQSGGAVVTLSRRSRDNVIAGGAAGVRGSGVATDGGRARDAAVELETLVEFPPRDESLDFRERLVSHYRTVLGRPEGGSFVDIEGSVVWIQEYLRYRVNLCTHHDAVHRVLMQIDGLGIQPVCGFSDSLAFPPRNEPFDFRQQLEAKYRDDLRRTVTSTHVDIEGDIVWTQEYLRLRATGCSHGRAYGRVFALVDGRSIIPCQAPLTDSCQVIESIHSARYGAIAISDSTFSWGWGINFASQNEAAQTARNFCGASDCGVVASFNNGYGALAQKQGRLAWGSGTTRAVAEDAAVAGCNGSPTPVPPPAPTPPGPTPTPGPQTADPNAIARQIALVTMTGLQEAVISVVGGPGITGATLLTVRSYDVQCPGGGQVIVGPLPPGIGFSDRAIGITGVTTRWQQCGWDAGGVSYRATGTLALDGVYRPFDDAQVIPVMGIFTVAPAGNIPVDGIVMDENGFNGIVGDQTVSVIGPGVGSPPPNILGRWAGRASFTSGPCSGSANISFDLTGPTNNITGSAFFAVRPNSIGADPVCSLDFPNGPIGASATMAVTGVATGAQITLTATGPAGTLMLSGQRNGTGTFMRGSYSGTVQGFPVVGDWQVIR